MKILIIGSDQHLMEAKAKFGDIHDYGHALNHAGAAIENCNVIFDFVIDETSDMTDIYQGNGKAVVFLNATNLSLKELSGKTPLRQSFFGFCGLPTFLNRERLEVSIGRPEDLGLLDAVCDTLNTKYQVVADRVGLVTPRVICMIINEAYCTVGEGTASREDIDLAMKLGTNYPYGPFEWCERIGAGHVIRVLESVYHDTQDERYRVCDLLKKEIQGMQ